MSKNTPHTSPTGSVTFHFLVFNFIENQISLKCAPSMRPLESEARIWHLAFNHDHSACPKDPLMGARPFKSPFIQSNFCRFKKSSRSSGLVQKAQCPKCTHAGLRRCVIWFIDQKKWRLSGHSTMAK